MSKLRVDEIANRNDDSMPKIRHMSYNSLYGTDTSGNPLAVYVTTNRLVGRLGSGALQDLGGADVFEHILQTSVNARINEYITNYDETTIAALVARLALAEGKIALIEQTTGLEPDWEVLAGTLMTFMDWRNLESTEFGNLKEYIDNLDGGSF